MSKLKRVTYNEGDGMANGILEGMPKNGRIEIAGSLRRRKSSIGDFDFVVTDNPAIRSWLKRNGFTGGDHKQTGVIEGMQVEMYLTDKQHFGAMLLYATGPMRLNILMRSMAKNNGLHLNQNGLYNNGVLIASETEEDLFKALGMRVTEPCYRENKIESEGVKTYQILSSHGDKFYTVANNVGSWSCNCPHYIYRMSSVGGDCKHIIEAKSRGN